MRYVIILDFGNDTTIEATELEDLDRAKELAPVLKRRGQAKRVLIEAREVIHVL